MARAEVFVQSAAHPGVIVRFAEVEARITMAMKGPLTFSVDRVNGVRSVIVNEPGSQAKTALPSSPWRDPAIESLSLSH